MRINITGNAGAGKTTLARCVGGELDLPVESLDSVVWRAGWRKTPIAERELAETAMVSRPAWVIDGVSNRVREAADLVVFLDVPRRVCVWRCAKRNWRYLFRSRPGLPERCPEWRIIPRLLALIWRFHAVGRPKILLESAATPGRFRVVRSPDELTRLMRELRRFDQNVVPVAAHR